MGPAPDRAGLLLPFRNPPAGGPPLRVEVTVERPVPWVDALVALLREIPGIEVRARTARSAGTIRKPGWLAERLYEMSRSRFDPFGEIECNAAPPPQTVGAGG